MQNISRRVILLLCVFRQAKTARGHRFLQEREAKVVENTKSAMFIRGTTTSQLVNDAMADLVLSEYGLNAF
jgi:hypothetical protein